MEKIWHASLCHRRGQHGRSVLLTVETCHLRGIEHLQTISSST
jgi:hypothetical protein